MTDLTEQIRTLGFGGSLGAGLAGSAQVLGFLPTELGAALSVGGLLGAGMHGLLDAVVVRLFLSPLWKRRQHYRRLLEIQELYKDGFITDDHRITLLRNENNRYFGLK